MCTSLFVTVFDFDLSQFSDQWMPANCQCYHPWPFAMDDTNETSAPSKSTTFATPETKQTKDHVSDQKVTASSETKDEVADGEMRRERRTSSYLARRRREIQWFHLQDVTFHSFS